MDNSDYIARKIKEGFENVESRAPEGVWSAINDELDDQVDAIDEKVKSSFEKKNEPAPKGIWVGIDKQLTIDKGWKKVYKYLQLQTFYTWTRRAAALLILLFLVATGFYHLFYKIETTKLAQHDFEYAKKEKQSKTTINQSNSLKKALSVGSITTISNSEETHASHLREHFNTTNQSLKKVSSTSTYLNKSSNYLFNGLSNKEKNEQALIDTLQNKIDTKSKLSEEKSRFSLEGSTKYLIIENGLNDNNANIKSDHDSLIVFTNNSDSLVISNFPTDSSDNIFAQQNISSTRENEENISTKKAKFELGITIAVNSTAIINNTTTNAFNETSLVTFVPSFGSNIGLQFLYRLREKHSLVSNVTYSSVNQSYKTFSNGRLNEEEISVGFIRLQPLYQFSYQSYKSKRTALNIKAGPFFGVVTKSKRNINDISESINYTNFDFGLSLQVGQSIDFSKIIIDYGINIDSGLTNLNKGINDSPASFDKTTHLGLGAYVSLRYKL